MPEKNARPLPPSLSVNAADATPASGWLVHRRIIRVAFNSMPGGLAARPATWQDESPVALMATRQMARNEVSD